MKTEKEIVIDCAEVLCQIEYENSFGDVEHDIDIISVLAGCIDVMPLIEKKELEDLKIRLSKHYFNEMFNYFLERESAIDTNYSLKGL